MAGGNHLAATGTHQSGKALFGVVVNVFMHHEQRSRPDDEFGQRRVREGHDPDLRRATEDSRRPEW
jgi:hypothetical protein